MKFGYKTLLKRIHYKTYMRECNNVMWNANFVRGSFKQLISSAPRKTWYACSSRGTGAPSEILVGWILQEERGEGRIEQTAWNTELHQCLHPARLWNGSRNDPHDHRTHLLPVFSRQTAQVGLVRMLQSRQLSAL